MTKREKQFLLFSSYASILTGIAYGVFKYFIRIEGPFGEGNHPFQAHMHHLHIILSPLLVFAIGLLWQNHIWKRIQTGYKRLRKTGIALTISFILMSASGYLLQSSSAPITIEVWKWVHLFSGGVWLLFFVYHQMHGEKLAKS